VDQQQPSERSRQVLKIVCYATGLGALICFVIAGMQEGFRWQYEQTRARLEQNGKLIEATIIEKEVVTTTTGSGSSRSTNTNHWIRYLPDGEPNTKENLIWETVSPRDFEQFEEGQRIHAWILGDEHMIKELGGFYSEMPSIDLLLVGGVLAVAWLVVLTLRRGIQTEGGSDFRSSG